MGKRAFRVPESNPPDSQRMTHSHFRKSRRHPARYEGNLSVLRTLLVRLSLISAFLVLLATLAHGESGRYFDKKRYPIVPAAIFPADEFVLAQARFWWEIYVVIEDDEGLL